MDTAMLSAVLSIVIGVVSCFFGYRIYRVLLALQGFFVGFTLGTSLVTGQSETVTLLIGVGVGIALALVAYYLYVLAFVLFGALLGLAVGTLLIDLLALVESGTIALVLLVGLVLGGLFGYVIKDVVIIVATAFTGAAQVVYGVAILVPSLPLAQQGSLEGGTEGLVSLVIIVVLALIGGNFQIRDRRRDHSR